MWIKLRTTNVIERAFREVRRRTMPMSCFNHDQSIERIVYAVLNHLNEQWGKTLKGIYTKKLTLPELILFDFFEHIILRFVS